MNVLVSQKHELFERLIDRLSFLAERAENGRRDAQFNANEHAGRLESRYDTFKEEAQFLAAGQQHRHAVITGWITSLNRMIAFDEGVLDQTDTVGIGALVHVALSGGMDVFRFFLLPTGGGEVLEGEEGPVEVLNVATPLGQALIGKRAGQRVAIGNSGGHGIILEVS